MTLRSSTPQPRSSDDALTDRGVPDVRNASTTADRTDAPRRAADQTQSDEDLARTIELRSPEGRPADPKFGPVALTLLIGGAILAIVVAAIIAGILGSPALGVVVLLFGLGVGIFANPAIWNTGLRAEERGRIMKNQNTHASSKR